MLLHWDEWWDYNNLLENRLLPLQKDVERIKWAVKRNFDRDLEWPKIANTDLFSDVENMRFDEWLANID